MAGARELAGLLALGACAAVSPGRDVPAVIGNATFESRAELRRVVGHALGGAPVTLADDALTRESELIIEPARARDPQGAPLDGRERGRPERFRLVKSDGRCVLVHERTGKRFTLAEAACAPK